MKILIGTPIHESKDYAMERWLENVARLQQHTPADLLMVDNSPGLDFVEKVKGYCGKYGIIEYKLVHIEMDSDSISEERLARSREEIRKQILDGNYDAWFSWECDQLIPDNALMKLIELAKIGHCSIVTHNSWTRGAPTEANISFGCALVMQKCLKKYGFLLQYDYCDSEIPNARYGGDVWFLKRIIRDGDNVLGVSGKINPIYHLNE